MTLSRPAPSSKRISSRSRFYPDTTLPAREKPFFTGYFEPGTEGALAREPALSSPDFGPPPDLVTLPQGERLPGPDEVLTSARRMAERLLPFPDRAAIEAGALSGQGLELVWLKDRVEVFIIQVQGSARVKLTDGRLIRLRYAGRNGWPYTSVGRLLIEKGAIAEHEMSLEVLTGWLRAIPGKPRRSCGATAPMCSLRSRRRTARKKDRSAARACL